jgi:hypothetical protein
VCLCLPTAQQEPVLPKPPSQGPHGVPRAMIPLRDSESSALRGHPGKAPLRDFHASTSGQATLPAVSLEAEMQLALAIFSSSSSAQPVRAAGDAHTA